MELFFRDNHSFDRIEIVEAGEDISKAINDLLLENYPHLFSKKGQIHVEIIGGANINSLNFRVGERYYLKFLPITKALVQPELNILIGRQLEYCGFNSCGFYKLKNGATFSSIFGSPFFSDSFFFLQDFISETFFSGTKYQIEQIPSLISGLETIFTQERGWNSQNLFQNHSPYINIQLLPDWEACKKLLANIHLESDAYIRQTYKEFTEFIETYFIIYSAELIDLLKNPSFGVYHSDLHPHNILVDRVGKLWVIDYESFRYMPVLIYRGFSIFKLFRKGISKALISLDECRVILRNNFTEQEKRLLAFGAQTELIRRIIYILNLHYKQSDSRWNFDLVKHTAGLKESMLLF